MSQPSSASGLVDAMLAFFLWRESERCDHLSTCRPSYPVPLCLRKLINSLRRKVLRNMVDDLQTG
jgi:hypothetical protein